MIAWLFASAIWGVVAVEVRVLLRLRCEGRELDRQLAAWERFAEENHWFRQ